MVIEQDDGLAHLNDLEVTGGFDSDAGLEERAYQEPAAGESRRWDSRIKWFRLKGVRLRG